MRALTNGAVEVQNRTGGNFVINGQRLKHYIAGDEIPADKESEESHEVSAEEADPQDKPA
jgi:hypothetical protein